MEIIVKESEKLLSLHQKKLCVKQFWPTINVQHFPFNNDVKFSGLNRKFDAKLCFVRNYDHLFMYDSPLITDIKLHSINRHTIIKIRIRDRVRLILTLSECLLYFLHAPRFGSGAIGGEGRGVGFIIVVGAGFWEGRGAYKGEIASGTVVRF